MQMLSAPPTAATSFSWGLAPTLLALAVILVGCGLFGGGSGGGDDLSSPSPPTELNATSQDGAVGLDWGSSEGADTYRVYRSTSSGTSASGSPLETEVGPTDYVDETAENGTTYYYVVTAVASDEGESAESDPSGEVGKTPFSKPPNRP